MCLNPDRNHMSVLKALALAGAKVRAQINIQGKSDVISSAANVVQLALGAHLPRNAPTEALPQPSSLTRKCNRLRHDSRPQNPETLDFHMDDSALPENFLSADIKVGNRRHLVFYNDQLLDLLKAAKEWYVDGTLKSVGALFVQLWSIHVFILYGDLVKQVPVLYSLMSGKSTEDYKVILEHISQSNALKIQSVVMDFENATWNAFRDIFPEADRKGCHFHWTQALWRKVQALGLAVAYNTNAQVHKFIHRLMCLPLLPPGHMHTSKPTFASILAFDTAQTPMSPVLRQFLDYIQTQ